MPRRVLLTAAFALSALALAACGSSGSSDIVPAPSGGATQASTPTTPKPPPALRTKPVVHVSPSSCSAKSLVRKDLVVGNGSMALAGQNVTVNYVGVICKTGQEFDSSWKRGTPFTTPLSAGSVMAGWVQGIPGMHVGGRRELIIPSSLAYGKTGTQGIPPNSTLVFVVDLLSVS